MQDSMTTTEIRIKKKALRKEYKKIRADISNKGEQNEMICNKVLCSASYKYCNKLLVFCSFGDEPSTERIISNAIMDGKSVYFPKCFDGGIMRFFKVNDLSELKAGAFGIMEPDENALEFSQDSDTNVLCIVPGILFDTFGYRIGYGKGYYDRFLSKFKGISMGICFNECLSENPLPYEKRYEKQIDMLVTPKEVFLFGK